jgi:hypothetical protein
VVVTVAVLVAVLVVVAVLVAVASCCTTAVGWSCPRSLAISGA